MTACHTRGEPDTTETNDKTQINYVGITVLSTLRTTETLKSTETFEENEFMKRYLHCSGQGAKFEFCVGEQGGNS